MGLEDKQIGEIRKAFKAIQVVTKKLFYQSALYHGQKEKWIQGVPNAKCEHMKNIQTQSCSMYVITAIRVGRTRLD
jgi:hypothetical protein